MTISNSAPAEQYRHSWLQSLNSLSSAKTQMADLDAHMKEWSDAGWRLVTATSVTRDGPVYQEITHTLFWAKQAQ